MAANCNNSQPSPVLPQIVQQHRIVCVCGVCMWCACVCVCGVCVCVCGVHVCVCMCEITLT